MANWIEAVAGAAVALLAIISGLWVLNNKIDKKADKDIMADKLEKIAITLGKLENGQQDANEKLDDIKKELEKYREEQTRLKEDLLVLKTEHESRVSCDWKK